MLWLSILICAVKAEETLRLNGIREERRFKEWITNISHDLRTPFTAIKGYQQLMEKGTLLDEQRQKLKVAQKSTNKLGDLIDHFFEYSCLINASPEVNWNLSLCDISFCYEQLFHLSDLFCQSFYMEYPPVFK